MKSRWAIAFLEELSDCIFIQVNLSYCWNKEVKAELRRLKLKDIDSGAYVHGKFNSKLKK